MVWQRLCCHWVISISKATRVFIEILMWKIVISRKIFSRYVHRRCLSLFKSIDIHWGWPFISTRSASFVTTSSATSFSLLSIAVKHVWSLGSALNESRTVSAFSVRRVIIDALVLNISLVYQAVFIITLCIFRVGVFLGVVVRIRVVIFILTSEILSLSADLNEHYDEIEECETH